MVTALQLDQEERFAFEKAARSKPRERASTVYDQKAAQTVRGNLPRQLTSFIGHTREIEELWYEAGTWFVELASVSEPRLVVEVVAATVGIRQSAGESAVYALC